MGILRDPPSVFKGTISYKYFFVELVKPFLRTNVRTHERLNEENLSRELGVPQIISFKKQFGDIFHRYGYIPMFNTTPQIVDTTLFFIRNYRLAIP